MLVGSQVVAGEVVRRRWTCLGEVEGQNPILEGEVVVLRPLWLRMS